jgi:hypothetical protein
LLHTRSQRNFTSGSEAAGTQALDDVSSESVADRLDIGDHDDSDDPMDFNWLSESLIAGAASANLDKDIGNLGDPNDSDSELPSVITVQASSGPLTITIPPLNLATLTPQATQVKKTCIPLQILFDYPANMDVTNLPSEGMNSFWRGGIENLEKEMEAYEILNSSGESSDGIQPDIPSTLVDLDSVYVR